MRINTSIETVSALAQHSDDVRSRIFLFFPIGEMVFLSPRLDQLKRQKEITSHVIGVLGWSWPTFTHMPIPYGTRHIPNRYLRRTLYLLTLSEIVRTERTLQQTTQPRQTTALDLSFGGQGLATEVLPFSGMHRFLLIIKDTLSGSVLGGILVILN